MNTGAILALCCTCMRNMLVNSIDNAREACGNCPQAKRLPDSYEAANNRGGPSPQPIQLEERGQIIGLCRRDPNV